MGSAYYGTPERARGGNPLSPMHSEKKKSTSVPVYSFTWFDVAVVFVSIGTYLADIITDILVTLVYWKLDEKTWAILTLLFLVVPSIIMQIFSTRWYLADGHKASPSLFFIHVIMMGPIKRYIEVLNHGIRARRTKRIEDYQAMYSELSDVSMLRLFESFLESAPQLVLQLYIMIKVTEDDHILTGIAAFFSLISLAWAIAAYTKALRTAVYSQDSRKKRVSYSGLALQTFWRVGMVAGRIIALVLCATIYPVWVLVGVGIHWFVMTLWLVLQDTDFCATWWEERLFNAVVGVIHIFCFFNMKEGRSRWRMVSFYAVTFVENSVMILLWYPYRRENMWYNIPAMFGVWGGYFLGLAAMVLYYRYFHPSSPKKCHCCMLYYHMLYKCCPCHDVTLFHETPYRRKMNVDETSSEFEYGNSNSRQEHHVICRIDGEDDSDSSDVDEHKFIMMHPRLTSTPGNELNGKYEHFVEQSLEILEESETDRVHTKGLTNDSCADPDDAVKNDLILKSLPGGKTGPSANRGNSTLVREWVKKTQDIYGPKDETVVKVNSGKAISEFGTLRHATKDERQFMQMHFGNFDDKPTGRRDILRLKSFSKKDRQQSNEVTEPTTRTNTDTVLRNTFREAFGFYTVDGAKGKEIPKRKKVIRKQPNRRVKNKSKLWTVVDIDGESSDQSDDCKASDQIPYFTDAVTVNKISARLDLPPEVPRNHDVHRKGRLGTPRKRRQREPCSSHSKDNLTHVRSGDKGQTSNTSYTRPCMVIQSNGNRQVVIDPHRKVLSSTNTNRVTIDEEAMKSIADVDDIPFADASEPKDAGVEECHGKCINLVGESNNLLPSQTSDNHESCESGPITLKEKRISKLCSEYFGPIIQVKGDKVTVKHRDLTPLEIHPSEPTDRPPIGEIELSVKQDSSSNFDISDSFGVCAQPNVVLKSRELVSTSQSNMDASLKVFKPSIIRSNIAQTLAASDRPDPSFEKTKLHQNRRRLRSHGAHNFTDDSNARKKLSFMKSSKSYNLQDAKAERSDENCKARFSTVELDLTKENKSAQSVDALCCSMDRMLDGTDNYKIHLKDTENVVGQKFSPKKSKKGARKKMRSERKTLGAIENT